MSYNLGIKSQLDARELLLLEQEVKSRGKNMILAYVLWYFLGMIGGHRFYLGKIGTAVAQLILTLTVAGIIVTAIWWIVDAFLVFQIVRDKNNEVETEVLDEIVAHRKPFPPGTF
ncbi:TM2 domain-containing protein [Paenibacillus protaetiae]|uniref:TM2 domain-containing protein n=1 Tax=Paenibacillus protaetiae TaxID=2509456 RepID=A0A4P6EYE8_9BACL|nr:TM2 domain-containing protein [Paenibacillus protaetiae]QAY66809.1 TM2 domain-containing protein [Paenibacillus protaetiae]